MRVVVYPHVLTMGGSQLNAVELAAAVRDRDHEVTVFGQPGPLVEYVRELGLPFVASPRPGRRPSPSVTAALTKLVRDRGADVVHGYEWPPALEAAYGPGLLHGVAAVATVMSMGIAPFLPPQLPLTVGTALLQEDTRARRPGPVELLEPPVDTRANAPGNAGGDDPEGRSLRARLELDPADVHVVVVSRLAAELKLEGLLEAVSAFGELAAHAPSRPPRLVVVGDGPGRGAMDAAAARVNAAAGARVVIMAGELADPRPAYALADVTLGMGGSALRALAFAKPLIVQGEGGFWELLTPETTPTFLHQGWYGIGPGTGGPARLVSLLTPLLADLGTREKLGPYGRELVEARFSLTGAAERVEAFYRAALAARPHGPAAVLPVAGGIARSLAGLANYKVTRRYARLRGTAADEDFNARRQQPVARQGGETS